MGIVKVCGAAALIFVAVFLLMACKKSDFESVDAVRFAKHIATPGVQIVDVRTAAEFSEGHIPAAVNMDVNSPEFDAQIATLDKGRGVALYCRSGRRSKIAAQRVVAAGYRVVELDGGILSWPGELER